MIFRRVVQAEMPRVIRMQSDIFYGEQGIPKEDLNAFLQRNPVCWCAERDGKICATAAAWQEGGKLHWGRFAVLPELRGQGIGTELAEFSFDDIFSGGTETVCMEARDTTVRIVCSMGGEITGEPFLFYGANVTPLTLHRAAYRYAVRKDEERKHI